jgi:DNA-binding transcriptional regulator YdaS (Cro superfamily)
MDLRTYTSGLPHGGISALASVLRVTPVYLSQIAARQNGREASPELCVLIESATERSVMRWDLRPDDWYRIWPELIGAEGAPPPFATAAPQSAAAAGQPAFEDTAAGAA